MRPYARRIGIGVAIVILIAAATTTVVTFGTQQDAKAQAAPSQVSVIVSPHPDDEMQTWGLVENSPDNYKVFVFLTRGEQTGQCDRSLPGLQRDSGERAPRPTPTGRWSTTCADARIESTITFLNRMNDHDSSLPGDFTLVGNAGPFPDNGANVCRADNFDGTCTTVDRTARVFSGGARGAAIFFNLGDGDLTEDEVIWATNTVINNRTALSLNTTLPLHNLLAGSFYNNDPAACYVYSHGDHGAVHQAFWLHTFTPFKYQTAPTCASDPDAVRGSVINSTIWQNAFSVAQDGTRIGHHPVVYGWTLTPYYIGDGGASTQVELFHRNQWYWQRS